MIILPRGSFTSTRILCSDAKMANFLIIPLALMESVKSKWTMHSEFAHDNIRANLAAPGAIETDMNRELKEDTKKLEEVIKKIPVGRIGTPQEVANVVEF